MTEIVAYLRFDGNCREAMTFYHQCLGGELTLQTVAESPMAAQMPKETGLLILHSTIKRGNLSLMGSDTMGHEVGKGSSIALTLNCSSPEEINSCFASLSAGGQVTYPLRTEFWGATFGQLVDRYGINWMLNYEKKA